MRQSISGLALALLLVTANPAKAVIFLFLQDPHDDREVVLAARDKKEVIESRKKLDELTGKCHRLRERHISDVFGKPQQKPEKGYAMPVAQSRGLILSGLRHGDPKMNKDHRDFHVIKEIGAVEVWYHTDGVTPVAFLIYFPAGDDFPKLTADNLAERLAWEEARMKKLVVFFESRMAELFPYEIDRKDLAKLHEGDFAVNANAKLEAWIKSGEKLGFTYKHEEGSNEWYWYRPDGKLAREALHGAKGGPPVRFSWYYPDGTSEARREVFHLSDGTLNSRWWGRPGGRKGIRSEGNGMWEWYSPEGFVRQEWDDNGDGIPDWFFENDKPQIPVAVEERTERRKPLKPKDSWAVSPKLIPEGCRIHDQPELRVPVRLKAS